MVKRIGICVLMALLFVVLFFERKLGINLVLFEAVIIPIIFVLNRPKKFNYLFITVIISVIVTLLMTQLWNFSWAKIVNACLVLTLAEMAVLPENRSFYHVMIFAVGKAFTSQVEVLNSTGSTKDTVFQTALKHLLWMVLIPIFVIFVFLLIYTSLSASYVPMFEPISKAYIGLFNKIDCSTLRLILCFIIGLIVANALLVRTKKYGFFDYDQSDALSRVKIRYGRRPLLMGLKHQNRKGIVLLIILNVLLLVVNFIELATLLFGYDWNLSLMKEYVHQGAAVLVICSLITILLVRWYFGKNLNFYYKVKPLKKLTFFWISQNIFLVLFIRLRVLRYMNYFGMAFGRIALLFFLILAVFGLITTIIKIAKLKSTFFLWRVNSYALLLLFVITTCFNWNTIIAKYNIAHCETAFVDYKFLAMRLNDSALPILVESVENSDYIEAQQNRAFPELKKQPYYMTKDEYVAYVLQRKNNFMQSFREESWLEWNLSDWLTYRKLLQMEEKP